MARWLRATMSLTATWNRWAIADNVSPGLTTYVVDGTVVVVGAVATVGRVVEVVVDETRGWPRFDVLQPARTTASTSATAQAPTGVRGYE